MRNLRGSVLQRCAIFRGLDSGALARVLGAARNRRWPRGARLVHEGGRADSVHLVLKGSVKLTVACRGESSITLKLAHTGDLLGEASVLARVPYQFSASAIAKSEGLSWSAATFEQLAGDIRQLAFNSMALAVESEQRLVRRICASLTATVEERIARSLVDLATAGIDLGADQLLRVGGREIAELSGTTVYTVSRMIASWKRAGIVAGGRGRITVIDLERLLRIARNQLDAP
jgi:CRP-like cAMP-binding protein